MEGIRFWLLGPVRVSALGSDHQLLLRGRMPRAFLAVLGFEGPGRVVPAHRIVDSLWDRPPQSARSNLRTHKARLVRELGNVGLGDRIITGPRATGYGLRADRSEIDVTRFRDLVIRGRALLRRREFDAAAAAFADAVALWRGQADAGLPDAKRLTALADVVNRERLSAIEAFARAAILARRLPDAIVELDRSVIDDPTRETAWVLMACAHYLNGNAAAAQATLRRAYRALDDAVGLGPSRDLRTAEHAAIRHDDEWFRAYLAEIDPPKRW